MNFFVRQINKLNIVFAGVLFGFLILVLSMGIFNTNQIVYSFNPVIVIGGIILYIPLVILMYKKLIPKLVKFKKVHWILFGIFIFLCLFFGNIFLLNPEWDMGNVYKIASNFANGNETLEAGYLIQYPNNRVITIIYCVLFKLFSIFNYRNYIVVATVFNSLVVAASIIILYFSIERIFDKSKAMLAFIICMLTTPLYMYCAVYYSDTLSMLMCSLLLFVLTFFKEENSKKKNIVLACILSILIAIAWEIKITSIFIVIAALVYQIITKFNKKSIIMDCVIGFISIAIIFSSSVIFNRALKVNENTNYYKVPIQHWLMIGLVDNGTYNKELIEYTVSHGSTADMKQADLVKIKEILNEYNPVSFVNHLLIKLRFAWNDGTYYGPVKLELNPVKRTLVHEIVLKDGKYVNVYKYIPQIMHFALFIFILISVFKMLKQKEKNKFKSVAIISMMGIILFLLMWENRSRYTLTLFPVYMLLAVDGVGYLSDFLGKKK